MTVLSQQGQELDRLSAELAKVQLSEQEWPPQLAALRDMVEQEAAQIDRDRIGGHMADTHCTKQGLCIELMRTLAVRLHLYDTAASTDSVAINHPL